MHFLREAIDHEIPRQDFTQQMWIGLFRLFVELSASTASAPSRSSRSRGPLDVEKRCGRLPWILLSTSHTPPSYRSGRKHVRARRHIDILAFVAAVDLRVTSNLWVRHCAASHRRMTFEDGTWLGYDLTASISLRNSTAGALAYPTEQNATLGLRQTRLRRTHIAES